ncbi:MAG TPA: methyltransferase domain-containing protein [Bacteriovoracaceae bacterium]|nr:methyltransferase domain-containing protein [Bacteriovoracaceae bacterium]
MIPAPRDYSFIAPLYDHVFNIPLSEGHREIGSLIKTLSKKPGMKILEVGVGSGLTLNHVPNNQAFTGVDSNERMLSFASAKASKLKRKKITLMKMDAHKLEFKASSFDLVLAPSVITALKSPEKGMQEMVRVTKKGGHIAVIANLRVKNSFRSGMVRLVDPITRKFLGYRTDMDIETFAAFKGLKLVERKQINSVMGMHLSWFLLFKKM